MNCQHPIFCNNAILEAVSSANIYNDSKYFVDQVLKVPLKEALNALSKDALSDKTKLSAALNSIFNPPGSDLETATLQDWKLNPDKFLDGVRNETIMNWGRDLHGLWQKHARQPKDSSASCIGNINKTEGLKCTSSILSTKNPFIVAGGRFNEFYYWDTFWIIRGLLASKMFTTCKGVIMNFLDYVEEIGFIPNGNRVYYLNRSQPPLLIQMVYDYLSQKFDIELFNRALPLLDKEYEFWIVKRSVWLQSDKQQSLPLNVYSATNATAPRPESFSADFKLASSIQSQEAKANFYAEIVSTAESGWDFSSRWLRDQQSRGLQNTIIRSLVPVDLNSIMLLNEQTLAHFHALSDCIGGDIGQLSRCRSTFNRQFIQWSMNPVETDWFDLRKQSFLDRKYNQMQVAKFYAQAAANRKGQMEKYLWSAQDKLWLDYDWEKKSIRQSSTVYASSIFPLWAGIHVNSSVPVSDVEQMLKRLNQTLLGPYLGGVPASSASSGQQWDFPNGWAPIQWIAVESLLNLRSSNPSSTLSDSSLQIANSIVSRWLETNFCGWQRSKAKTTNTMMFEKYDVRYGDGVPGDGGEYAVQDGFGWTNGVALDWLSRFSAEDSPIKIQPQAFQCRHEFGGTSVQPTDSSGYDVAMAAFIFLSLAIILPSVVLPILKRFQTPNAQQTEGKPYRSVSHEEIPV